MRRSPKPIAVTPSPPRAVRLAQGMWPQRTVRPTPGCDPETARITHTPSTRSGLTRIASPFPTNPGSDPESARTTYALDLGAGSEPVDEELDAPAAAAAQVVGDEGFYVSLFGFDGGPRPDLLERLLAELHG